jgi:transposase
MQDWLPEDHFARFVSEVVDQLDLSELTRQYAGRGSRAHHPVVLLGLLIYGYATGVFSSRKLHAPPMTRLPSGIWRPTRIRIATP